MSYYLTTTCNGTEGPIINSPELIIAPGVYFIEFTGETQSGCFTVGEETMDDPTEGLDTLIPYADCFECFAPPRSASTEYIECVICTDNSGTTITQVVPPHPVWTDGYGATVTQMNMITLGGMFGLNN